MTQQETVLIGAEEWRGLLERVLANLLGESLSGWTPLGAWGGNRHDSWVWTWVLTEQATGLARYATFSLTEDVEADDGTYLAAFEAGVENQDYQFNRHDTASFRYTAAELLGHRLDEDLADQLQGAMRQSLAMKVVTRVPSSEGVQPSPASHEPLIAPGQRVTYGGPLVASSDTAGFFESPYIKEAFMDLLSLGAADQGQELTVRKVAASYGLTLTDLDIAQLRVQLQAIESDLARHMGERRAPKHFRKPF